MTEQHPLEGTAGEITGALTRDEESAAALSSDFAAKIIADGEAILRAQRGAVAPALLSASEPTSGAKSPSLRRWRERTAWLLAAAATLAWFVLPSPVRRGDDQARDSVVALRDSLTVQPGVIRLAWAPSTDPAGRSATGEVIWDASTQRGVMKFTGLVPNDARTAQYQLWIVDAERDARYPVDGGVFDVNSEGEVLVPIAARLPVGRPTLFAVTLEPPGGVVVSTRERLVLAAPVPTA